MIAHKPSVRRRGLTLTEALVALFVAAIGMISLLTLFPLGALQMAQALKDHRCAETVYNFEALLRSEWRAGNVTGLNFADVVSGTPNITSGRSNPVFLDPLGANAGGGINNSWIASKNKVSGTSYGLPRGTLTTYTTSQQRLRFCSLLDDLTYDEGGAPVVTGGNIERGARYHSLAMLQRPNVADPNLTKLTVLVFDGRAPFFMPADSEQNFTSSVTFTVGTTGISFGSGGKVPNVAKGRWLMLYTPSSTQGAAVSFHRVVSVDDSNSPTYNLELQTPITNIHGTTTEVIVFTGLAEVFERPVLTNN